jgi:DNA-binding SARP family transcriptional activator/TolB-like protein
VLRLHTLGSVFVAADSGEPLGGAAAQRRTLALLAALTLAGEGGLSRDKIVGLLWPETDPERARHSLTQALYAARRALQADDLFTVNADVRLNRQRLGCDVSELEAALDAGNLEHAVTLYTGPFLDGFFLSGSPEFEQWSSLHRARLEARVAAALERLAESAETQGDHRHAVEWRKRISAMRPLDSGNTLKLMMALVETGDRAGALQQARVHELLLREQLDLEPDVAVLTLSRKLREPSQPTQVDRGDPSGLISARHEPVGPEKSFPGVEPRDSIFLSRSLLPAWFPTKLADSWKLTAVIVVALALLLAAIIINREPRAPEISARPPLRQKVVVAPFRVAGAASSLHYLRDGIVELLSTRLADDTAARAVDAGAVLGAWEGAGFTTAGAIPRDSIVKLAAQLGAERVVIGSVVGTPSRLILRASVVAVPSAIVSGEASVEGTADSISALIDGLAAKLLVSQAGEEERLASYTTASLPALRAYLAGQAAFRQDDYAGAIRRYQRALDLDPTFPLAALHLAMAADRQNDAEQRRRGIAQAWASRDALSERDLTLLTALAGPKYPLPSFAGEQLTAWRRLVDLAPNDAGSWYLLGARLFHDGATAGMPAADSRAAASLERALSIDADHSPASLLLYHLITTGRSSSSADDPGLDTALAGSLKPFASFLRWRVALAQGDTAELRRVGGSLRRYDAFNLRAMSMASQFDGLGLGDGAHANEILATRATSRSDRLDVLLAQHSLAVQQGRPQTALAITTRLGALLSGSHAHLRLRILDALYAEGDTAAAQGAARELETLTGGGLAAAAFASDTRMADLCVLSQWRASSGDTAGMSTAIDALHRAAATTRYLLPVTAAPGACAELLEGWLAVLVKRGDALSRVERLDSLALTSQTAGDAIAYAPILVARLYERLGQPGRALQAIRKRSYMSGWPRYLATAWREEGRLAQIVGDGGGAKTAYERYLALRVSPEESVAAQVDQVRSLLASVKTSAGP